MDTFDLEILNLLQENTHQTTEEIGKKVGLSATACQRRIKRLREDGTIVKEVALLAENKFDSRITVIINVILKQGGSDYIDKFKSNVVDVPQVKHCYYVTGEYDFILIVSTRDMESYEKLTRELFFDNPIIHKFQSIVSMEKVKEDFKLPIL